MKKHVKNYFKYYGYGEQDVILCESCTMPANSLHHLVFRSHGGSDEPENILALCQICHDRSHFKKKPYLTFEQLKEIHSKFYP